MAHSPTRQKKPAPRPTSAAPEPAQPDRSGDSISGSIGDNARGAAIGKNIFQNIIVIGTLKSRSCPSWRSSCWSWRRLHFLACASWGQLK